MDPVAAGDLTMDERAGVRTFLQRSEVRLSTIHRVASALLSGAGLMVLLPAVERDAVVSVLRTLLTGRTDATHVMLVLAVGVSLALPFTALWLLLRDLTQFYFHANHLRSGDYEAFMPRFTLTGLRLPAGELGDRAAGALAAARADTANVELLVPGNDKSRRQLDRRFGAYGLADATSAQGDRQRAELSLALAASRSRSLIDEVAKVEYGLARHVLRIQAIVLRYVKALLALLTTALAIFALAAVVDHGQPVPGHPIGGGELVWFAAILLIWAPVVVVAVTTPVRWLDRQLRNEGADHTAVAEDPELTRVEVVTVRLAAVAFLAALGGMIAALTSAETSGRTVLGGVIVMAVTMVTLGAVLMAWSSGHPIRRLLRRH